MKYLCLIFLCCGEDQLRGPFAKFVDSPYYSESELCGGSVTVYFLKYLPWQAMNFLQRSIHFSKTCCRPLITSKFLSSELLFMVVKAQKSNGTISGLYGGCSSGLPLIHLFQAKNRIQFRSRPMRSELFQPRKWSSEARNFEVINGLQHVFKKWVERCKKYIACQANYFEKETVTAPPQSSDSE
jgi:hypothetical protein